MAGMEGKEDGGGDSGLSEWTNDVWGGEEDDEDDDGGDGESRGVLHSSSSSSSSSLPPSGSGETLLLFILSSSLDGFWPVKACEGDDEEEEVDNEDEGKCRAGRE